MTQANELSHDAKVWLKNALQATRTNIPGTGYMSSEFDTWWRTCLDQPGFSEAWAWMQRRGAGPELAAAIDALDAE